MKKLYIIYFITFLSFSSSKYVADKEISKLKYIPVDNTNKSKVVNKNVVIKKEENKKIDDIYVSTVKIFNIDTKELVSSLDGVNGAKVKSVDNSVVISGKKSEVFSILELIHKLDKKKRQVLVKINIIETSSNLFDRVGFNWRLGKDSKDANSLSFLDGKLSLANLFNVGGYFFGVDIDALKEKGDIMVKSVPALTIIEGSDGEIKITSEMILGTRKNKEEKYTNYEAGMIVKIHPKIRMRSFNEYIDLQIYTEMSNFKLFGNEKGKVKNIFNTNLMVKNKGSMFIGGLNEKSVKRSEDGVKYLSDIPLFGNLFRKRNNTKEKRDIYLEVEASIEE